MGNCITNAGGGIRKGSAHDQAAAIHARPLDTTEMTLEELFRMGIAEAQLAASSSLLKRDRLRHIHTARELLKVALQRCQASDADLRAHLYAVLLKLGEDARSLQHSPSASGAASRRNGAVGASAGAAVRAGAGSGSSAASASIGGSAPRGNRGVPALTALEASVNGNGAGGGALGAGALEGTGGIAAAERTNLGPPLVVAGGGSALGTRDGIARESAAERTEDYVETKSDGSSEAAETPRLRQLEYSEMSSHDKELLPLTHSGVSDDMLEEVVSATQSRPSSHEPDVSLSAASSAFDVRFATVAGGGSTALAVAAAAAAANAAGASCSGNTANAAVTAAGAADNEWSGGREQRSGSLASASSRLVTARLMTTLREVDDSDAEQSESLSPTTVSASAAQAARRMARKVLGALPAAGRDPERGNTDRNFSGTSGGASSSAPGTASTQQAQGGAKEPPPPGAGPSETSPLSSRTPSISSFLAGALHVYTTPAAAQDVSDLSAASGDEPDDAGVAAGVAAAAQQTSGLLADCPATPAPSAAASASVVAPSPALGSAQVDADFGAAAAWPPGPASPGGCSGVGGSFAAWPTAGPPAAASAGWPGASSSAATAGSAGAAALQWPTSAAPWGAVSPAVVPASSSAAASLAQAQGSATATALWPSEASEEAGQVAGKMRTQPGQFGTSRLGSKQRRQQARAAAEASALATGTPVAAISSVGGFEVPQLAKQQMQSSSGGSGSGSQGSMTDSDDGSSSAADGEAKQDAVKFTPPPRLRAAQDEDNLREDGDEMLGAPGSAEGVAGTVASSAAAAAPRTEGVRNPLSRPELFVRAPAAVGAAPQRESAIMDSPAPSSRCALDTLSITGSCAPSGAPSAMPSPFCGAAAPRNSSFLSLSSAAASMPSPSPAQTDVVSVRILNGVSGEEEVRFSLHINATLSEQHFLALLDVRCRQRASQSLADLNWLYKKEPGDRFQRRKCDVRMVEDLLGPEAQKKKGPLVLLLCTVPVRPPSELPACKVRLKTLIPARVSSGQVQPIRVKLETVLLEEGHEYSVAFTHQWTSMTYNVEISVLANRKGVEFELPSQLLAVEGLYDLHLIVDRTSRSENRRTLTVVSAESEMSSSSATFVAGNCR
eukprot:TRINITY_DN2290_c0_g1_i1.p1 TRINITY_DN2290_c0_g1~~TRINITY_DN2290_c0_g1_i1.p1  ORF type:complete len:1125 (-),score=266.48 TRINITY_DN2290_c0_g1_i1:346-3720(-)